MPGAYSNLLYHLVFSTKERRPLISAAIKPRLHDYIGGIVRGEKGELLAINSVADHTHLLVRLPPTRAVADMLRLIKGSSSKWANETLRRGPTFAWQEGYAAFTVSQSQVPRLLAYIRAQESRWQEELRPFGALRVKCRSILSASFGPISTTDNRLHPLSELAPRCWPLNDRIRLT